MPSWKPAGQTRIAATVDARRGILYFFDSANARIRALDLASGRLRTVAGGGTRRSGGEATALSLGTVGRLAVSPEWDLYFCDPDRNAGVRIYLGNP